MHVTCLILVLCCWNCKPDRPQGPTVTQEFLQDHLAAHIKFTLFSPAHILPQDSHKIPQNHESNKEIPVNCALCSSSLSTVFFHHVFHHVFFIRV